MFFRTGGFLGAIFDFDGVVVDTVPLHFKAWKRMFEEFGKVFTFEDYKEKIDGISRLSGAKAVLGELPDTELEEACNRKQRYFMELLEQEPIQVFEDTLTLIKELKIRGVKIALISSSKNASAILKKLGLEEFFDTTVLAEPGIKPKPNPDIFLEAARRLGVHPSFCVVFEDAKLGVEAAKRAGMFCVGIYRTTDPNILGHADLTIRDLEELAIDKLEKLLGQNQFRGMKSDFDFCPMLSNEEWLVTQQDFNSRNQRIWESIFSLGNGYLGHRGTLEEVPPGSFPGTYIAGLFDKSQAQTTQLVNIPNPVHFRIRIGKKDLSLKKCIEHYRALDMKNGLLIRKTVFDMKRTGKIQYKSTLFFSMRDKNIGILRVFLTPLDKDVTFTVKSRIDGRVLNWDSTQKRSVKHFDITDIGEFNGICYLVAKTKDKKIPIIVTSHLGVIFGQPKTEKDEVLETTYRIHQEEITRELKIKAQKNQTLCLTKIFFMKHFRPDSNVRLVKKIGIAALQRSIAQGYDYLFNRHIKALADKWKMADIEIKGDPSMQRAVRFNIYHLLICAPDSPQTSIGARALTGEGYAGHIFWDTEIYILPFFIYTDPKISKNLLMYRYLRLKAAKEKAKEYGFGGALFPWESADSGEEVTPAWAKGNFGRITRILTGELQHHIVSDIAYAIINYWQATKDTKFMERYGLELLFETARFWSSRVTYNKKLDRYNIRHVIGPDEFHERVNDNAYTNVLAAWNLRIAYELLSEFRLISPKTIQKLCAEMGITDEEILGWRRIADLIYVPKNNLLLEEHDGYFRKKDVVFETDLYAFPIFPREIPPGTKLNRTQLVKQADVVLLLYLLGDLFSKDEKKENFDYFQQRTLHSSSLSCSIYSIVASENGNRELAYQLFRHSALTDLENIYNSKSGGIHIAACGGTWQAVVFGFAGLRIGREKFFFEPSLPLHWNEIYFKLKWRRSLFSCKITKESVEITKLKGP